ncbi:unnamed protein product, partial [Rotaria sordida]
MHTKDIAQAEGVTKIHVITMLDRRIVEAFQQRCYSLISYNYLTAIWIKLNDNDKPTDVLAIALEEDNSP